MAQQYFTTYRELIPVSQIVREEAAIMQEFTQSGGVRPFGVSLMMAGFDDSGPQLFQVDPSGTYFGWKASAIGKNHVSLACRVALLFILRIVVLFCYLT